MEYNFSGIVTLWDYIKLNRKLSRKNTITRYICGIVVFVGLLFLLSPEGQIDRIIDEPSILFSYAFLLLLFTAIYAVLELFTVLHYRKIYRSDKSASSERKYRITNETISVVIEDTNMRTVEKGRINKIIYEADRIYIFESLVSVITIKKSFFVGEEKFEEIKSFIINNFDNKQKQTAHNKR